MFRNRRPSEPDSLSQIYSPPQGSDVVRYLLTVLLVITFVLSAVTTVVVVAKPTLGGEVGVLSLRSAPPPADTPLFMVESSANARYLRGAVGTRYDAKVWELRILKRADLDLDICAGSEDLPLRPAEAGFSYREFDREVLNSASVVADERYFELPDGISDRIRELSLDITSAFDTPFEKALGIEVYLRLNYDYDLDYEPAPANWEPNDWFLFESREGICGNFASAFVVLARASGLPSRLAAGYFVQAGEGQQTVYADQAHAWAEVGFEDLGWLAFDAT